MALCLQQIMSLLSCPLTGCTLPVQRSSEDSRMTGVNTSGGPKRLKNIQCPGITKHKLTLKKQTIQKLQSFISEKAFKKVLAPPGCHTAASNRGALKSFSHTSPKKSPVIHTYLSYTYLQDEMLAVLIFCNSFSSSNTTILTLLH